MIITHWGIVSIIAKSLFKDAGNPNTLCCLHSSVGQLIYCLLCDLCRKTAVLTLRALVPVSLIKNETGVSGNR